MQPFVCPQCSHESTYDPWVESARCPACGYTPRPSDSAMLSPHPSESVDTASQLIRVGRREEAKRMLGRLLRSYPDHALAWGLLSGLVDDPAQQADCLRQILRLDPGNRQVAEALRHLTGAQPALVQPEAGLRCPGCNAPLEVRFVGELYDKRAVCRYCSTQVDLPDAYRRVQHRHAQEEHDWGSRVVDTMIVETRSDGALGDEPDASGTGPEEMRSMVEKQVEQMIDTTLPERAGSGDMLRVLRGLSEAESERLRQGQMTPQELYRLVTELGADISREDLARELAEQGFAAFPSKDQTHESITSHLEWEKYTVSSPAPRPSGQDTRPRGVLGAVLDLFARETGRRRKRDDSTPGEEGNLSPEAIIRLAGGPLPPEKRTTCPQCQATISTDASWCQWCGTRFSDESDR
jgi:hypothetical protein